MHLNKLMLTLIILLPFLAAIGLAFVPVRFRFVMRLVALATTLLVALLGVVLFCRFAAETEGYQFVPEQSTAAIVVHHPQSVYFAVRTPDAEVAAV